MRKSEEGCGTSQWKWKGSSRVLIDCFLPLFAMPISSGPRSNSAVKREREILLQRAEQEKQERLRKQEQDGDGDLARLGRRVEAEAESARAERRKEYDRAVSATASVPLQKLALSPCGVALFDELCLRVDVNQRYAECLPQWGDLARALDVDELKTRWVEACVRPSEGLTRLGTGHSRSVSDGLLNVAEV